LPERYNGWFREQHDKVIESGFSKASEINRNDLLEYKEKKINKRVPLVLTYHPSLEKIAGIVRHHWIRCFAIDIAKYLTPFLLSCYGTLVRVAIGDSTSWKENQRQKKELLDSPVTNITYGRHKQKGLNLLFFNFNIFFLNNFLFFPLSNYNII
jgi:hypothetical protein